MYVSFLFSKKNAVSAGTRSDEAYLRSTGYGNPETYFVYTRVKDGTVLMYWNPHSGMQYIKVYFFLSSAFLQYIFSHFSSR